MDNDIEKIVTKLVDGMGTISKSETIVGAPQQAGAASVIPIHRVKVVFGVGTSSAGAKGDRSGGDWAGHGAGGAVEIDPIAAIAVGADGRAKLLTVEAEDLDAFWVDLVRKVPGVLRKVASVAGDKALSALAKSDALERLFSREESSRELAEEGSGDEEAGGEEAAAQLSEGEE